MAGQAGRVFIGLCLLAACAALPGWSAAASRLLASASMLTLDTARHSVSLNVDTASGAALRQIARGQPGALPGDPASYRSALLVLDDPALTAAGAKGGYFYKLYLTPAADVQPSEQQLVGTLGPFEIAAARQRGDASLRYAVGGAMAGALGVQGTQPLVLQFRRAGGADGSGPLIRIGGLRLELSTEVEN
jgi:tyrosinase